MGAPSPAHRPRRNWDRNYFDGRRPTDPLGWLAAGVGVPRGPRGPGGAAGGGCRVAAGRRPRAREPTAFPGMNLPSSRPRPPHRVPFGTCLELVTSPSEDEGRSPPGNQPCVPGRWHGSWGREPGRGGPEAEGSGFARLAPGPSLLRPFVPAELAGGCWGGRRRRRSNGRAARGAVPGVSGTGAGSQRAGRRCGRGRGPGVGGDRLGGSSEEEPGGAVLSALCSPERPAPAGSARGVCGHRPLRPRRRAFQRPGRASVLLARPGGRALLRWGAGLPRGRGEGRSVCAPGAGIAPLEGPGVPRRQPPLGSRAGWAARERGSPTSSPPRPVSPQEPGAPAPRGDHGTQPQGAAARMLGRLSIAGRSLLVPHLAGTMGGGGSALRVCADHRGGINWLSLSPDGQRLLTGSEDGTARLWSTADGQCCALLQGRPAAPRRRPSCCVFAHPLLDTSAPPSADPPQAPPRPSREGAVYRLGIRAHARWGCRAGGRGWGAGDATAGAKITGQPAA